MHADTQILKCHNHFERQVDKKKGRRQKGIGRLTGRLIASRPISLDNRNRLISMTMSMHCSMNALTDEINGVKNGVHFQRRLDLSWLESDDIGDVIVAANFLPFQNAQPVFFSAQY
jgi:hypothetical protein